MEIASLVSLASLVGTTVIIKGTEKVVDMGAELLAKGTEKLVNMSNKKEVNMSTTWLAPRFTAGMETTRAKLQKIKDKMTVQSSKVAGISDSAIMEMRERMELKISAISNYDSRIEVPAEKEMGNVVTLVFNRYHRKRKNGLL